MPVPDLRQFLRRLVVTAGLPLVPAACADAALPEPPADAATSPDAGSGGPPLAAPGCVGAWGSWKQTGGCQSGPYTARIENFLLLDATSAEQASWYARCLARGACPEELCTALIGYKGSEGTFVSERFGALERCAPACKDGKDGKQPGVHVVYTVIGSCAGRRPEGLAPPGPLAGADLGAFFAEAARLEAASAPAFIQLAGELSAHGAPDALIAAAVRAAEDEIRHFETTAALARRFGGSPEIPEIALGPPRPLEALAAENAVEGCVRETLGAAIGLWQATTATDPRVRAAMAPIAQDEAGHATLAWRVDEWARARLGAGARRRLDDARDAAVAQLLAAAAAAAPLSAAVARRAGLPAAEAERDLVADLQAALWQRASGRLAA